MIFSHRHIATIASLLVILVLAAAGVAQTASSDAPATAADAPTRTVPAWPRSFEKDGNTLLMYQPQVEEWTDYAKIKFLMAIALTQAGTGKQHYGVAAVQADTQVDNDNHMVDMTNLDVAINFPGLSSADAAPLKALVRECLPNLDHVDIALEQVLAYVHAKDVVRTADVSLAPPPIYYSDVPAILVIYIGNPQFKPVSGTQLMFAANTNWLVMMDMESAQYYILDGDSWLTSPDPVNGPWTAAQSLPTDFNNLPSGSQWDNARKHIPGTTATSVPRVIVSTEPAELILTDGTPEYEFIPGVHIMYVGNPTMPLFLDLSDSDYYYLVAGRWFKAPKLTGPWAAASTDLPAEFAKIPQDSPMGFVLASIPGTQEAEDAALLASVPHKATIKIDDAKLDVTYDGTPKFDTITGTSMQYAVNTSYEVIGASGQYYCCSQGVWFDAPAPTGPWTVCTSVPGVIYTIPPSCPVYNVTYVKVYDATPTTVVVGYTSGYSGQYVAATGALMFGAGMLTGALLADNDNCCWYGCNPCYYSYGCAAHYSYAYGGYYRTGGAYYGPYGGAGWGSAYNPATGTWARGGAAYGPHGAAWGGQAYNPWTNTYAAHAGGTNGYSSWGSSYVQQGNKWAQAGHESDARGGVGYAENSSGQWAEGAHSNVTNSTVAKTSNGDVYAGHDGNVYKKDSGGQWQKYQGNGGWQDTAWNKNGAYNQQASSAASERNYQNSTQNRTAATSQQNRWGQGGSADQWKSNWENGAGSGGNRWDQHANQTSLNSDSWARNRGSSNASSSWGSRSGGGRFGGGGGFGGGRFGGGGGHFGGRR